MSSTDFAAANCLTSAAAAAAADVRCQWLPGRITIAAVVVATD